MSFDAVAKIAEESKKITDVAENSPTLSRNLFEIIVSSIKTGIFVSPPFSLENYFPNVDLFKNKYFKLISIVAIYLGLMLYILSAFKPANTRNMFLVYSVCFWIAAMAFSIIIVNPYDENSVEPMLKDKEKTIEKMKEIEKAKEIEQAKKMIKEPVESESSDMSSMKLVFAVILMLFFGALKIYSYLATPV